MCSNNFMNKKIKIVAGIILFNPEIQRLSENIVSISKQVDKIIFFDNGSSNSNEIKRLLKNIKKDHTLLYSKTNKGIATALNEIAKYSFNCGYKWLLTLDQDSVCYSNLISTYRKFLDLPNAGQITCNNKDRNLKKLYTQETYGFKEIKYCITSGTLLNLQAWKDVGGFDSTLFIDRVDNEMCCALRNKGYVTYKVDFFGILHEMGHIKQKSILKKSIVVMNYNPFRYYYIARNSILIAKRYPNEENLSRAIVHQLKIEFKIILFEKNKFSKSKAVFKGIKDGIKISSKRKNYLG